MNHKVFGIGLNKTGTSTLAQCLIELGYRHMSVQKYALVEWFKGNLNPLFEICDSYDSFEDWPYPLAYKELFHRYGDSGRYILTVRSSSAVWLESLKNHSLQTDPKEHCRLLAYGFNYPHGLERQHINFYERHNSDVVEFFKKNNSEHLLKILCWESSGDWLELCSFLEKSCPLVDFPHINKMTDHKILSSEFHAKNIDKISEQLHLLGIN
jgi:hypothetical protein